MVDSWKVVKGLECCIRSDATGECPDECPYYNSCWVDEDLYVSLHKDAIELLKGDQGWISVEDKLHYKCGSYLVYFGKGIGTTMKVAYWLSGKQIWKGAEAYSTLNGITHWMPLPKSPEGVKQDAID